MNKQQNHVKMGVWHPSNGSGPPVFPGLWSYSWAYEVLFDLDIGPKLSKHGSTVNIWLFILMLYLDSWWWLLVLELVWHSPWYWIAKLCKAWIVTVFRAEKSRHQVYSSLFKSICLGCFFGHETSVLQRQDRKSSFSSLLAWVGGRVRCRWDNQDRQCDCLGGEAGAATRRIELDLDGSEWIWMDLECWFQHVPALNHDEVLGRFTFVPSTIPGLNYPELNFFGRISEAKQRRGT